MTDKSSRQTPEEIEKEWFLNVYTGRGDSMAQLTLRAVIMGSFLGGFMSLSNLYIGLKTGWGKPRRGVWRREPLRFYSQDAIGFKKIGRIIILDTIDHQNKAI